MTIPQIIGNYRIERLIGAGGMANVYLATHLLLNRPFAIKIMKPSLGDQDPNLVKRFIREAQLAQKANHPNIVNVIDVGNDTNSGLLYIVMEYVEGVNLSDYSRKKKIPEDKLIEIAYEVTKALVVLHKVGIVHRDIKPSNIMLCNDGSIKLMDLGIAKGKPLGDDKTEGTLTMDDAILGTPAYVSPEQCRNSKTVDIRSDIYCLGASLYSIASGQAPYGGTTAMEILMKVLEDDPRPLAEIRPDLSEFFISLINSMMDKSPENRPQTPQELLSTLLTGRLLVRKKKNTLMLATAVAALLLLLSICVIMAIAVKRNAATTAVNQQDEGKSNPTANGNHAAEEASNAMPSETAAGAATTATQGAAEAKSPKRKEPTSDNSVQTSGVETKTLQTKQKSLPKSQAKNDEAVVLDKDDFIKAALDCDIMKLQNYLEKGFSPDTIIEENKNTLLEYACSKKNLDMIELLLKYKVNTELHNANETTPLAMSADFRNPAFDLSVFKLLLEHGANPNVNPLRYLNSKYYLLDFLMQHSPPDNNEELRLSFIKAILKSGNAKIGTNYTYYFCFLSKYQSILPLLIQNTKKFESDVPVLPIAIAFDVSDEIVNLLIQKGASVNCPIPKEKLRYVLGRKYKTELGDKNQMESRTALYIAVEMRRASTVKILLEHGADSNWTSESGKSIRQLDTSNEIKELLQMPRQ